MRRLLGMVLLALVLTACGEETDTATTPASSTPTASPQLVSGTAGRGEVETSATELPDDAAVKEYVAQFDDSLASDVAEAAAATTVDGDEVLIAQVIAIGCDVPPDATVRGRVIVPARVPSPMQECFAPVTTVALAVVPS